MSKNSDTDFDADSVLLVVSEGIAPGLLARAVTGGSQFVLSAAYETLISVDCEGAVQAGLAASWTANGSRLTLTLRDDARFWSGDRVTASEIVQGWRASGSAQVSRFADSAVVVDDRTLSVPIGQHGLPRLASTQYWVRRATPTGDWPEGTGRRMLTAAGGVELPSTPRYRARIVVRSAQGTAARDMIDRGADVVLSDDPSIVAYAESRVGRASAALEWDRTYALILRYRDSAYTPDSSHMRDARAALARDAVRADARTAELPVWFDARANCPVVLGERRPPSRIVYANTDPVAKGVAERIVALAGIPAGAVNGADAARAFGIAPGTRLSAVALNIDALERALRDGTETAYVVAMPFHTERVCGFASVTPLIDTRWRVVTRIPMRAQ